MGESDLQYYERRQQEEIALADAATSPEVVSAHRALALIYADEVRRLAPAAPRMLLVPR